MLMFFCSVSASTTKGNAELDIDDSNTWFKNLGKKYTHFNIHPLTCCQWKPRFLTKVTYKGGGDGGSRMAQRSKACRARGVTTDPGSRLGCITTDHDRESHRVAHN
jgi:hypothetical protein